MGGRSSGCLGRRRSSSRSAPRPSTSKEAAYHPADFSRVFSSFCRTFPSQLQNTRRLVHSQLNVGLGHLSGGICLAFLPLGIWELPKRGGLSRPRGSPSW